MKTTYRPMSGRRLAELRGYVAWPISALRAALFAAGVGGFSLALRAVLARFGVHSRLAWLLPAVAFGAWIYVASARWTGGRALRAAIRRDIAGGVLAALEVTAIDAIEVEEGEDEGPAFFVLTEEGATLVFSGQYLDSLKRKGFPWSRFEILEAPHSKRFFGLVKLGQSLAPSARRGPFTWEEFKRYGCNDHEYAVLDEDFQALKAKGGGEQVG